MTQHPVRATLAALLWQELLWRAPPAERIRADQQDRHPCSHIVPSHAALVATLTKLTSSSDKSGDHSE